MDPSLLKEREAFLRRAKNMPVVERPRTQQPAVVQSSSPGPTPAKRPMLASTRDYLALDTRPQNQGKFTLLSRVVKYMKVLDRILM